MVASFQNYVNLSTGMSRVHDSNEEKRLIIIAFETVLFITNLPFLFYHDPSFLAQLCMRRVLQFWCSLKYVNNKNKMDATMSVL